MNTRKIFTMRSLRRKVEEEEWKMYIVVGFAFVFMLLLGILLHLSLEPLTNVHQLGIYGASKDSKPVDESGSEQELLFSEGNYAPTARKIFTANTNTTTEDYSGDQGDGSPNRVGVGAGEPCSKDDILVFQGATVPLPNGIPTYTVEIQNVCLIEGCNISGIHLSCGWFSSARLIDPSVFRRLDYDDCLVNDGKPLNSGEALNFEYANSFKYPLSVSSVSCP